MNAMKETMSGMTEMRLRNFVFTTYAVLWQNFALKIVDESH